MLPFRLWDVELLMRIYSRFQSKTFGTSPNCMFFRGAIIKVACFQCVFFFFDGRSNSVLGVYNTLQFVFFGGSPEWH